MAAAVARLSFRAVVVFVLVLAIATPYVALAQSTAPAPAPSSDVVLLVCESALTGCLEDALFNLGRRSSIDLGIAYVLMLAALVLTYLIHPLDASSYFF
ncbi:hypothetical protein RJ639_043613 [Escallonia herrerae]|uniref:Transmembrane protein n=1 Tax=Escallonia herrerae TaxID=1293975 RepID=A0AA88WAZ5_9ASTE|nr:hypothetical protein RJ639_043613 [Escallonia herrerae]